MKVSIDKNHLLVSRNLKTITNINNDYTKSENVHEFLGITICSIFGLIKY